MPGMGAQAAGEQVEGHAAGRKAWQGARARVRLLDLPLPSVPLAACYPIASPATFPLQLLYQLNWWKGSEFKMTLQCLDSLHAKLTSL